MLHCMWHARLTDLKIVLSRLCNIIHFIGNICAVSCSVECRLLPDSEGHSCRRHVRRNILSTQNYIKQSNRQTAGR